MNLSTERLRLLVFLTVGVGVVTYCIAESDWLLALLAIPAWAMSWMVSLGPHGRPIPRPIILLVVLSALAYSVQRVAGDSQDLVVAVARLMLWLQLVKLYDRWSLRDRGVILVMSVFLVIGALLTSNALLLGAMLVIYLPLMVWTVLAHELSVVSRVNDAPTHRRRSSRGMRRDLARLAMVIGAMALTTAIGVFLLVPRGVGEGFLGDWGAPAAFRVSGFNDSVTLGSGGLISESKTPVMDVMLRNAAGVNIGAVDRALLLRGAVMDTYDDGRWTRSRSAERRDFEYHLSPNQTQTLDPPTPQRPMYTLDVVMHRRPGEHLFTMLRPISITLERGGRIEVGQSDLQIRASGSSSIRYSARVQLEEPGAVGVRGNRFFVEGPVRDLAESLLQEAEIAVDPEARTPADDEAAAAALMHHLHRNYLYTTQLTAADVGEDPIEMFLFRTKEGHCEYFASALAAMCMSVGIDARMVTGYMAIEFNEDSGAYTVRESNAHAWVEVQLEDGRWVNFDPSPPDDLAIVHEPEKGLRAMARNVIDAVSRWWINSVVAFNETRREAMVGKDPLGIERATRGFLIDSLLPTHAGGVPILLIALLRGIIAFGATAAVGFIVTQALAVLRVYRDRKREVRAELREDPSALERIEQRGFYNEALTTLRRAGLEKPRWRSARDHAAALVSIDRALADAMRSIADLYYASRFGRRLLTADELATAQSRVQTLRERIDAVQEVRRKRPVR